MQAVLDPERFQFRKLQDIVNSEERKKYEIFRTMVCRAVGKKLRVIALTQNYVLLRVKRGMIVVEQTWVSFISNK